MPKDSSKLAAKKAERGTTATVASSWRRMLQAVPHRNQAARLVSEEGDGSVTLAVPTKRPAFLFPPISWVIRPRKERLTVLDPIGASVWRACDGRQTIEEIVENFAARHRLSFHESRVSVTHYVKSLLQRGVLAVSIGTSD